MTDTDDVRNLLAGVRQGRSGDWERLFDLVYEDLRRIARHHLRGQRTGTLGTTAIVNEAYIRLAGAEGPWEDRAHFFAVASRAMRQILVSQARRKLALKRGGGAGATELDDHHGATDPMIAEVLELDDALEQLAKLNERLARIVELRFFGDLTVEETAEALGVTDRTVRREWRKARSFLHDRLRER